MAKYCAWEVIDPDHEHIGWNQLMSQRQFQPCAQGSITGLFLHLRSTSARPFFPVARGLIADERDLETLIHDPLSSFSFFFGKRKGSWMGLGNNINSWKGFENSPRLGLADKPPNSEFSFPRLIVVPLSSHAVDGVRKEKERLTAAEIFPPFGQHTVEISA